MTKVFVRVAIVLATWLTLMPGGIFAGSAPRPLGQTELVALVAGDTLPENVARQIAANGLAFHPDEAYRSFLRNAGADARILKALDVARVTVTQGTQDRANLEVLQHISEAARLMRVDAA